MDGEQLPESAFVPLYAGGTREWNPKALSDHCSSEGILKMGDGMEF